MVFRRCSRNFYFCSIWPPLASIIKFSIFRKFKNADFNTSCLIFMISRSMLTFKSSRFSALVCTLYPSNILIKVVTWVEVWWPCWPCTLSKKFFTKFRGQPLLNNIRCMRRGPILLKIIFFIFRSTQVLRPEPNFEHFQVIVLIYSCWKVIWPINLSGGNCEKN